MTIKENEHIATSPCTIALAGIAHDYNNLFALIHGNISLAKCEINTNDAIYEYLTIAEKGLVQAQKMTKLLFSYSLEKEIKKRPVSLTIIIQETTEFLLQNSKVITLYDLPETPLIIHCVEIEIRQIIRNIILNSKQAMLNGGTIRISVTEIFFPNDNPYSLTNGKYAKLSFEDEGKGISEEIINRIFDQNFTTKNDGHGLGLAICQSIVTKHKGHINVRSDNGKGTKFEIFLPIDEDYTEGVI
jgi:signal transduction histidine kinase